MNRETAVNAIKRQIGLGDNCKYKTIKQAAEAVGLNDVHFGRVLNSSGTTIPQKMLNIVGLEANPRPAATYKYRGR